MILYNYSSLKGLIWLPKILQEFSGTKLNFKKMKKIIFSIAVILFTVTASAQSNMAPKRYGLNVYQYSKFELITDTSLAKTYLKYSAPKDLVAIKITVSTDNAAFVVMLASKEEYTFLKNQLKTYNIQVALDDDRFIGYSKIIYY